MEKTVSEELRDIFIVYGEVVPSTVVDFARDPKTALHGHFQWDDAIAADEFRLTQARRLIRRVRIDIGESQERLVHIPARLTIVGQSREGSYKPLSILIKSQSEFSRAMGEARMTLEAAQKSLDELIKAAVKERHERLQDFQSASDALDDANKRLKGAG